MTDAVSSYRSHSSIRQTPNGATFASQHQHTQTTFFMGQLKFIRCIHHYRTIISSKKTSIVAEGTSGVFEARLETACEVWESHCEATRTGRQLNACKVAEPCAYANSFARSPTPFDAGRGANWRVLSVPNAFPCLSKKPLPLSPGIPGLTVATLCDQPSPGPGC